MNQLFISSGPGIGTSASASVLPMNIQGWFFLGLIWSPYSPRDSEESSPTPQFEGISSLALSLLYGPILTSIDDYWKNHSFDFVDLCHKVKSLLFNMLSRSIIAFLPGSRKNYGSFNFVAAVTICSDLRAQENKVCHCFHFSPIYLPWIPIYFKWYLFKIFIWLCWVLVVQWTL